MLETMQVDAILFDLDGTLIDSTPGVHKAWNAFSLDYSFDAAEAARASHGRRLHDTLKEWCKIDDEATLKAEVDRFETLVIDGGPIPLPGSISLLQQLSTEASFNWTIVTSATRIFAERVLQRCAIPIPRVGYVTSDDVSRGKPHPDPYITGARNCAVDPANCLVVEDAPSGIKAGRAAGARTLAVCTSHTRQQILDSGANPHFVVDDLTKVSMRWIDGRVEVVIDDSSSRFD